MQYSKYQEAVFQAAVNPNVHAVVVEAVAGSGKTTTIVECCKRITGLKQFFAFNKSIAEALKAKGVPASTIHSFGLKCCKAQNPKLKVNDYKIGDICKLVGVDRKHVNLVRRFCSLGKAYLVPGGFNRAKWQDLADHFDIDLKHVKDDQMEVFWSNVDRVYNESFNLNYGIDFDDMIAFPVMFEYPVEQFDAVVVDESQDLNPARLALLARAVKPSGKFIAVGDSKQAIYGFTGADSESMQKIVKQFNAITLPLSICYRCSKSVLREAQKIVPHIEWAEDAPEGNVKSVDLKSFDKGVKVGDYVLCRTTAPLVRECFNMLRSGKRAMVKGKEIGADLVSLIEKVANGTDDIIRFMELLGDYRAKEVAKLRAAEKDLQAEMLEDKIETLYVLSEGSPNVSGIRLKIESIFTDSTPDNVILLSTVHKAKGLESETVWILRPELLPHPKARQAWQKEQEMNLKYVAVTRAKLNLNFVHGDDSK
jgi:superfamily I DNA/RNA helicase